MEGIKTKKSMMNFFCLVHIHDMLGIRSQVGTLYTETMRFMKYAVRNTVKFPAHLSRNYRLMRCTSPHLMAARLVAVTLSHL